MSGSALRVAGAICLRTWRATARRPVTLTFSFVQPLFWVIFFGFLFQRYDLGGAAPSRPYLDFLIPGVCAMTVLFGASQAGIGLIRDLQTGFLRRILASPASTGAVLFGKVAADTTRLVVQALILLVVGRLLGARLMLTPGSLAAAAVALAAFGAAHSSVSCAVALRARAQETMATFVHLVNMPLLFTSSALVPERHMPGWLAAISRGNPLTLTVNTCRDALLEGEDVIVGASSAVLALIAAAAFGVAWAAARAIETR